MLWNNARPTSQTRKIDRDCIRYQKPVLMIVLDQDQDQDQDNNIQSKMGIQNNVQEKKTFIIQTLLETDQERNGPCALDLSMLHVLYNNSREEGGGRRGKSC